MPPIPDNSAPYSPGSAPERKAIKLLAAMFNTLLIKDELNVDDKIPNIDGYITLTNEQGHILGKLEAQVKTLPREYAQHPKYQCEGAFLKYCADSQLPVVLIVVDVEAKVAYWQHMDYRTLEHMSINYKGSSRVLHLKPEYRIEENNNSYWFQWVTICEEDKKVKEAGKLFQHIKTEEEDVQNFLKRVTNAQLGKQKPEFAEIHRFLDKFNMLLEQEFLSIKQSYYYGDWKQGLAYDLYTDSSVRLYKFGISYASNETLIKSIPTQMGIEELSKMKYFASSYENPVRRRPESFSYELIQKDVARMLEQKSFVSQNDYVAIEQIFHFIDRFYFMLRLEPRKRSYTTDEVKIAFQVWLKKWVSCWHHLNGGIDTLIDIDSLKLTPADINVVKQNIFLQKYPENVIMIFSDTYNFTLINDTLTKLKRKDVKNIERLCFPAQWYDELNEDQVMEEIKSNYERFYKVFPKVYDEFVKTYFPLLFDDLCYFRDFDKEMFLLNFEQGIMFPPKVHFWEMCFVDSTHKEHEPIVLIKELGEKPLQPLTFWEFENGERVDGKDQRLYYNSWGARQAINFSQDFLLHHSLYKLLRKRFKDFFEKKLNNEGLSRVIL
jgi:hypothetical protein